MGPLEELTKNLTSEQQKPFEEDTPYLNRFMAKYNVSLTDIRENDEYFPPEGLMYYFNDGLGGYSIEGIKNSLADLFLDQEIINDIYVRYKWLN